MILKAILSLLITLFGWVLDYCDVPSWQFETISNFMAHVETFISTIVTGAQILMNWTPFAYMLVLLGLVATLETFFTTYKVIRWVLKKIPFINIS